MKAIWIFFYCVPVWGPQVAGHLAVIFTISMHLPTQPHNLQVVTPVQLVFGVLSSLFSSIFLSTMVVNLGEKNYQTTLRP